MRVRYIVDPDKDTLTDDVGSIPAMRVRYIIGGSNRTVDVIGSIPAMRVRYIRVLSAVAP